jgi:hypothetical protein
METLLDWEVDYVSPLFKIWITSVVLVLVGLMASGYVAMTATRRWIKLWNAKGIGETHRITLRRTMRNETCFFLIQVMITMSTFSAGGVVTPTAPPGAIMYFYVATCVRIAISIILTYATLADLRDRKLIHAANNRAQAELWRREIAKRGA